MTDDTSPAAPATDLPDRLGGRFVLHRRLAQGGMGSVYEAHDEQLGREVAVKVLHDATSPAARERFRREARAAAALEHPNIVSIYDYGTEDGLHYLVLELVRGRDLAGLLADEGAFTPSRAVQTAAQVCEALAHAHAAGVVHRDIKPANILIEQGGRVQVTDFGIAAMADAAGVTVTGEVIGTARYCAPEQVAGDPVGPAADLYALGLVLYEMLTGQPAFDGDHPGAVAARRLTQPVPTPSRARPQLSGALDAVVIRATARDPAHRYTDAGDFRRALVEAADTVTMRPPTQPLETVPLTARTADADAIRTVGHAAPRWQTVTQVVGDRLRRVHRGSAVAGVALALLVVLVLTLLPSPQQIAEEGPATPGTQAPGTVTPDGSEPRAASPTTPATEPDRTAPPTTATYEISDAIIGLDTDDVAAELRGNGFEVEIVERTSDQPAGTVIDVDPGVGAHVRPGDTIILYTATG